MKRKAKTLQNDQVRKKKLLHFQRVFCDPPDAEALLQQVADLRAGSDKGKLTEISVGGVTGNEPFFLPLLD
jgi:hypothetical protein